MFNCRAVEHSSCNVLPLRRLQCAKLSTYAFRIKGDLGIRPIFHSKETRIESHVFVAFIAYSLSATLRLLLKQSASGLTFRAAFEKLSAIQMIDEHFPINDNNHLVFSCYTTPETDQELILDALKWKLPPQNPPKVMGNRSVETTGLATDFKTFFVDLQRFKTSKRRE